MAVPPGDADIMSAAAANSSSRPNVPGNEKTDANPDDSISGQEKTSIFSRLPKLSYTESILLAGACLFCALSVYLLPVAIGFAAIAIAGAVVSGVATKKILENSQESQPVKNEQHVKEISEQKQTIKILSDSEKGLKKQLKEKDNQSNQQEKALKAQLEQSNRQAEELKQNLAKESQRANSIAGTLDSNKLQASADKQALRAERDSFQRQLRQSNSLLADERGRANNAVAGNAHLQQQMQALQAGHGNDLAAANQQLNAAEAQERVAQAQAQLLAQQRDQAIIDQQATERLRADEEARRIAAEQARQRAEEESRRAEQERAAVTEAARRERARLEREKGSLEQGNHALNGQIATATSERDGFRNAAQESARERDEALAGRGQLQTENSDLQRQVRDLGDDLTAARKDVERARLEVVSLRELQIERDNAALDAAAEQLQRVNDVVAENKDSSGRIKAALAAQRKAEEELLAANNLVAKADQDLIAAHEQKDEANRRAQELEAANRKLSEERDAARRQTEAAKQETERAQGESSLLASELSTVKRDLSSVRSEVSRLQSLNGDLGREQDALQAQLDEARREVQKQEQAKIEMESKLAQANSMLAEFKEKRERLIVGLASFSWDIDPSQSFEDITLAALEKANFERQENALLTQELEQERQKTKPKRRGSTTWAPAYEVNQLIEQNDELTQQVRDLKSQLEESDLKLKGYVEEENSFPAVILDEVRNIASRKPSLKGEGVDEESLESFISYDVVDENSGDSPYSSRISNLEEKLAGYIKEIERYKTEIAVYKENADKQAEEIRFFQCMISQYEAVMRDNSQYQYESSSEDEDNKVSSGGIAGTDVTPTRDEVECLSDYFNIHMELMDIISGKEKQTGMNSGFNTPVNKFKKSHSLVYELADVSPSVLSPMPTFKGANLLGNLKHQRNGSGDAISDESSVANDGNKIVKSQDDINMGTSTTGEFVGRLRSKSVGDLTDGVDGKSEGEHVRRLRESQYATRAGVGLNYSNLT